MHRIGVCVWLAQDHTEPFCFLPPNSTLFPPTFSLLTQSWHQQNCSVNTLHSLPTSVTLTALLTLRTFFSFCDLIKNSLSNIWWKHMKVFLGKVWSLLPKFIIFWWWVYHLSPPPTYEPSRERGCILSSWQQTSHCNCIQYMPLKE